MSNVVRITIACAIFTLMVPVAWTQSCTQSQIEQVKTEFIPQMLGLADELHEVISDPPLTRDEYIFLYWSGMFLNGSIEMIFEDSTCHEIEPVINDIQSYFKTVALLGSIGVMPHDDNLTFDDNFVEMDMPRLFVELYLKDYENLDAFRPAR